MGLDELKRGAARTNCARGLRRARAGRCLAALAVAALALLALQAGALRAAAADRVALVVGESAYQTLPSRPGGGEDARAMAGALRAIGFEVAERYDLSGEDLHEAVVAFGGEAREAKIAVAYFSGHAFRLDGVDYLASTSADPEAADLAALLPLDGLRAAALRASDLGLTVIETNETGALGWEGAAPTAGLRALDREIVAYAYGAGAEAASDRPALFTMELAAALRAAPGEDAGLLLEAVAERARAQKGEGLGPELALGEIGDEAAALGAPEAVAEAGDLKRAGAPDDAAEPEERASVATGAAASARGAGGPPPREEGAIVVSAEGDGDFRSLRVAVEEAADGAILIILPGVYQGGFTIGKSLTLRGEGARDDIILESRGADVLRWTGASGRLENLTLRQKTEFGVEAASPWGAVDLLEGALTIENCDLTSESGAIIHVRDEARGEIRGNVIHSGPRSGVFVYRRGHADVSDNEIHSNKGSGVALGRERGVVHVRRNTLRDNDGSGVSVIGEGGGDILKNEIFANGESGVYAREEAHPRIVDNVIRDNRGSGVEVQDKGRAVIKGNEIVRNHYANIEIGEGARVRIEANVIRDGKQGGVFLHEASHGDIVRNEIFGNKLAAVELGGAAVGVLQENLLRDGRASALFIHSEAMAMVLDNRILGNGGVGLRIEEGASAVARRNEVKGNKGAGVYLNAASGELSENQIAENKDAGLEATNGATPTLVKNRIVGNGYVGVWLYDGGGALAVENDLTGNKSAPTKIEASAGTFTDQGNQLQ